LAAVAQVTLLAPVQSAEAAGAELLMARKTAGTSNLRTALGTNRWELELVSRAKDGMRRLIMFMIIRVFTLVT
jgi:hypothetical protein